MKNLAYTTIFGKKVSHDDALVERISDNISNIIANVYEISEKSFNRYDKAIKIAKKIVSENQNSIIDSGNEYLKSNKRLELLSEELYDKHKEEIKKELDNNSIQESINIKKYNDFING